MPRVKRYLEDENVLEAARERIRHVYDIFDSVVLMYSGGKDSSCCLLLMKEVHEERDLGPVECVFRDGETLPLSSIKLLEEVKDYDWVNLRWQCFPRIDQRLVLGTYKEHIRWGINRKDEWTRPMPEWAEKITDHGYPEDTIVNEDINMDELTAKKYPGSIAFITGIRASESLVRFRSVVNKLNENYINRIEGNAGSRIRMVKPIYDWEENDVLKYLHDNEFPLAEMYMGQERIGSPLRVGPPLGQASKRIGMLREIDPELYEAIVTSFPEMAVQDRYWDEFDLNAFMEKYSSEGFRGVMRYIHENIPPGPMRDKVVKRYRMYVAMAKNRPEEFPPEVLLKHTVTGANERKVRGTDPNAAAHKKKDKT